MSDQDRDSVSFREDGGYPPALEIAERLTRLEEKQDAQMEKLEYIAEQLDGRLSKVNGKVETMLPRHNRLWFMYKSGKWLLGAMLAGGMTVEIIGWF